MSNQERSNKTTAQEGTEYGLPEWKQSLLEHPELDHLLKGSMIELARMRICEEGPKNDLVFLAQHMLRHRSKIDGDSKSA